MTQEIVKLLKVAIIGKPNVGKSSLINNLLAKKVSIVSVKPQTTRNRIIHQYAKKDHLIMFLDTPGFHKPKNKLDEYLNKNVVHSIDDVDLVCLLIDCSRLIDDEDEQVIRKLNKAKKPYYLILTKIDLATPPQDKLISELTPLKTFEINNNHSQDAQLLLEAILEFNQKHNFQIPKQLCMLPDNDNLEIAEIIREQCLHLLKNEIPYGIAVQIDSTEYDNKKNLFSINATIVVEKESHKTIVIGAGGQMIKNIGTKARENLLNIYNCAIFLKLFVKVDKNWRDDINKLREFGYFK